MYLTLRAQPPVPHLIKALQLMKSPRELLPCSHTLLFLHLLNNVVQGAGLKHVVVYSCWKQRRRQLPGSTSPSYNHAPMRELEKDRPGPSPPALEEAFEEPEPAHRARLRTRPGSPVWEDSLWPIVC